MNLSELISQMFDSRAPLDTYRALKEANYKPTPTTAQFDQTLNSFADVLKQDKVRKALSIARALLLTSPDKTIKKIRRNGYFKCSRYAYRERSARAVVGDMLRNATIYELSQSHIDYLQSVDHLLSLGPNLQRERASLVKRLRDKESVVIKTLLANVDTFFTSGLPGDKSLNTEFLNAYLPEDMAEAFSYLLRLFQTCVDLKPTHFGIVDESSATKSFYQKMLIDAAKMCEFHAAEVLIDSFSYKATGYGKVIKIEPFTPLLEKSIRLGYIQVEMQRHIRDNRMYEENYSSQPIAQSIDRLAKECFDNAGVELVKLVEYPSARYVMQIPTNQKMFMPFCMNGLFLEDLFYLNMLGIEDYIATNEVAELPLVGNIKVIDILKVQRFFRFVNLCFFEAFSKNIEKPENIIIQLQSRIPVYQENILTGFLSKLLTPEKAKEILDVLTCDPKSSKLDLQYTPIISAHGWNMFSPAVFAGSNLVRNLLCHNNKRLTLRDNTDPMQIALANALKLANFSVETEITRKVDGNELEIDILAYRDDILFIFECKNAFHPCNVYEMRNSYDHIKHAAEQLEKRKSWLLDLSKQGTLFNSLGWDIDPTDQVLTCIAIGNRVFNGYECEGHPVRQVHELLNVLKSGEIVIDDERRRIWKGLSFSVDDLVTHLAGDNFIADFLQAMQQVNHQFKFGSKVLSITSYALDILEVTKTSKIRYPYIGPAMSD